MDSLHREIEAAITGATGREFRIASARAVGGGCIHAAEHLAGADQRDFFVKRNDPGYREPFECEALALREMAATRTLRVPRPVTVLEAAGRAVLVLEYLEMGGAGQADWRALGSGLARMHRHTGADFGWDRDNWTGRGTRSVRVAAISRRARASHSNGSGCVRRSNCWRPCRRFSGITSRRPRCCTATCGPATPTSCATARRSCLIQPATAATGKPTSP